MADAIKCAWSYETYDPLEGETPTPPVECTTGKPALYYNCNEFGPVCEDHTCRCRPKLLTEREEKARQDTMERSLRGLRRLGVPEQLLDPVVRHLAPKCPHGYTTLSLCGFCAAAKERDE